jgi:hypothetical protein
VYKCGGKLLAGTHDGKRLLTQQAWLVAQLLLHAQHNSHHAA